MTSQEATGRHFRVLLVNALSEQANPPRDITDLMTGFSLWATAKDIARRASLKLYRVPEGFDNDLHMFRVFRVQGGEGDWVGDYWSSPPDQMGEHEWRFDLSEAYQARG